jgi:hypothetical protein
VSALGHQVLMASVFDYPAALQNPLRSFSRGYLPSGPSRVAPPSKLEDFFPLPNPTLQGSFGFLQQRCDLAGPVRCLASE